MNKQLMLALALILTVISLVLYKRRLSYTKTVNSNKSKKVDIFPKKVKTKKIENKPMVLETEPVKLIPKKIFQLVPDKNNISEVFQKNIEYIKKTNPGWEYKIYDNKDQIEYIAANYPDNILDAYNMLNRKYGAALADYFRYLLMYVEGGVYLDIKSASRFPLDNIIGKDDEFILSHWDNASPHEDLLKKYGEFQQWHIICKPRHPALKVVIDKVTKNINNYNIAHGTGKPAVLKVTGPIAYTQSIIPLLSRYNFRISRSHADLGLIYCNIKGDHTKVFGKKHYSLQTEPLVLQENDIKMNPVCDAKDIFKEQGKCSVAIEMVPRCTSVLEFRSGSSDKVSAIINSYMYNKNKHIVVDEKVNKSNIGEYKVIKKPITELQLEDIVDITPIDCLISDCNSCLLNFFKSSTGQSILKSLKMVIMEIVDDVNDEIDQILSEHDLIHTNSGYGCGMSCSTYVYVKI